MPAIKMATIKRRNFLGVLGSAPLAWSQTAVHRPVSIVLDPADRIAAAPPVQWAAGELQHALTEGGVTVNIHERLSQAAAGDLCIVAGGPRPGVALPKASECMALAPSKEGGRQLVLASGS